MAWHRAKLLFSLQQGGKRIRMCQETLQAVSFTAPSSYQPPKVLPNSDSGKQQQKNISGQSQNRAPDCRRVISAGLPPLESRLHPQ